MDLLAILDQAIEDEKAAGRQYQEAAESSADPEARALLLRLARDEEEHRQVLEAQRRLLLGERTSGAAGSEPDVATRHDYLAARRLAETLLAANVELKQRQSLYEHELSLAADIQRTLLPLYVPRIPGLQIGAHISMARQVGGDYYDFATDTADRLQIAIGDVSGKGIPASLLMATARAVWQSIASGGPTDQGVVLEILNRSTFNDFSMSESFLTFISALYDAPSSVLHYANAGHNPPIYLAAGARSCEELEVTGPIIGFEREMRFREDCREMAPGDIVVFYTDGIVEARGAKGLYGQERLARQLIALRDRSADAITEGIVRSVMEFAGRQPLADDLTLIVLKRA